MENNSRKLWFKRKLYGWGWTPVTWQGWLVILVYVVLMLKIFTVIDNRSHSDSDTLINFFLPFAGLTSAVMIICFWKGEKPRWQWGERKEE